MSKPSFLFIMLSFSVVFCRYQVDPCSELFAVTGPCEAYIPSWSYNQGTGICDKFIYGGCEGNNNRFESKQGCADICEKTVDPCSEPFACGASPSCLMYIPRWSYNQETEKCENFIYGGCGCNNNMFENEQECADACETTGHSSCYANDSTPNRKFGLVTSYLVNANLDTTEISVPGCKPVMLYLLTRHGTRSPRHSIIEDIIEQMQGIKQAILKAWADGKSKMCQKDVINLEKWMLPYPADEDQQVGEAGRKEMRELGKRFGKRFPDLLKDSQKTVRKSSEDQRCNASMDTLLRGLYGHSVDFEESTADMFTFDMICSAFQQQLGGAQLDEMNKLEDSDAYEKMVAEISYRIGVQLNKEQLKLAFRVCGFDIANFPGKVSPWCALFSEGDMRLMEYSFNLANYYRFHTNISRQMTQPLMADLQKKLLLLKASNETPSAFLYMVHHEVLNSLMVALGLYRDDEPPLASDWPSPHCDTLCDSSTTFSFGSNLGLVALECDDPQHPLKVLALHNERKISMAQICEEEICNLQSVLGKIQPIVNVDFDKVCESKEPSYV